MDRIKSLLRHIITCARIEGNDDVALAASVMLGSIENDCMDEFAEKCEQFTNEKVVEIDFLMKVERMMELN